MAPLEDQFVRGLVWKTFFLGAALGAGTGWAVSWPFAGAVGLGTLVSGFNLRVVGWVSRKLIQAALSGDSRVPKWSFLIAVKLLILFALTYLVVIVLEADPIGYVAGYSSFLPALLWQAATVAGSDEQEQRDDDS